MSDAIDILLRDLTPRFAIATKRMIEASDQYFLAQVDLRDAKNRDTRAFKLRNLLRARAKLLAAAAQLELIRDEALRAANDIDAAYVIVGTERISRRERVG